VLDLGAGCGIVGLMLLASGRAQRVTAVERQPELAALVRRNIQANGLQAHMSLIEGDLRAAALPRVDVVVFNPPYFKVGHGHASGDPGRDAGRRELHGTLDDFLAQAAAAIGPTGHLAAIIPTARLRQFCATAHHLGLVLERHTAVHAFADSPQKHCLLQAGAAGATGLAGPGPTQPVPKALDQLVVHPAEGAGFSPYVQGLIDGHLPQP
jgi:tRNA1(Val) A37 N6-methylase TrmN6